jgi:hypothetical protein
MPMDRSLYPKNWNAIAAEVKTKADWICQECGKPCRRPNEDWLEFVGRLLSDVREDWYELTSDEVINDIGEYGVIERPQRFTLTVAHLNHQPQDCRLENLRAMCSTCHLKYDGEHHGRSRRNKKYKKLEEAGQLTLFGGI